MVLTLMVITRKVLNLEDYVTVDHIESMNKIIILTGSIVGCAYLTELFTAWYSQNPYEQYAFANRALGPYYWSYWSMMTCNVISPQLFWVRKLRRNVWFTFFMSIVINCGMWFERFVIIVTSLHRDFIPSSWAMYSPTWVEISFFLGTIGFFSTAFLVFAKLMPVIAMAEVKHILKTSGEAQKRAQLAEVKTHAAHGTQAVPQII
jgi:molybdopterin-containing oxidoreductase family membrane subunit